MQFMRSKLAKLAQKTSKKYVFGDLGDFGNADQKKAEMAIFTIFVENTNLKIYKSWTSQMEYVKLIGAPTRKLDNEQGCTEN